MTRSPSSFTMLLSRHTRRRAFIAGLGGAAAWPMVARAQQPERMRHIGVLMHVTENDSDAGQARLTPFVSRLRELGWVEGSNLRLDVRWGPDDPDRYPRQAAELVALGPDVLVAPTSTTAAALLRATRRIPIVFMGVIDPVGAGFVSSLAKPGGNATGFLAFEYTIGGKWLELLKQIAPQVSRAAVLRDASNASGIGQLGELCFRYKLPATYQGRAFVAAGGLMSYGPSLEDAYRIVGIYTGKVLKGAQPSDLPVQLQTNVDFFVNLQTAKRFGLEIPPNVLARADEVIE